MSSGPETRHTAELVGESAILQLCLMNFLNKRFHLPVIYIEKIKNVVDIQPGIIYN